MTSAFFVTGAGTDVGKTFVTARLIGHLRRRGGSVAALKPIVSGFDPAAPGGSDPILLLEALGRDVTAEEIAKISPWRFAAPLSPDMAAAAENRAIDVQGAIDFCRRAIAANDGVLLIEGVGGVMVPLDERHTVLDVMARLGLPLIFVGGSYLGAISHNLSALEILRLRGLHVGAVVICETPRSSVGLDASAATLAHFTAAPLLTLPRGLDAAQEEQAAARLAELIRA